MLAQQINRVLTTPVDVVANVNQADPNSKGFFHTFAKVAREGGRPVLWRGLQVALLLSFNPALMFTLVGKLTSVVQRLRDDDEDQLGVSDMFWISGVSKTIATLVTYPLIRAKAVVQSTTTGPAVGLRAMLAKIAKEDGMSGLFQGVWIMSFKTVLFNSLMMSLKQKLAMVDRERKEKRRKTLLDGFRQDLVVQAQAEAKPWEAAALGQSVVYVDGSWSFLHPAQEHILQEAAKRGDYLLVGVHSDEVHHYALGAYPKECFAARVARIQSHPSVAAVLEDAPWEVDEDLVRQLGISKVVSGTISKTVDGAPPAAGDASPSSDTSDDDPYSACKRLGIFEEVASLNDSTENSIWMERAARVFFSNVDASIDWRILVNSSEKSTWGRNPGYSAAGSRRMRSSSPVRSSRHHVPGQVRQRSQPRHSR